MSENPASSAKLCKSCGTDVTSAQRVKDAKGNYFCRDCAAKLQARNAAKPGGGGQLAGAGAGGGGGGDPDIMSKLVDDSIAKSAVSCPACRKPWREGAVICTACGYNKTTSQMVGTQIKEPAIIVDPKQPKAKGKRRGGKRFAGAHWKICLALVVIFGIGLALASQNAEIAVAFGLAVYLSTFVWQIGATIDAWMETESIIKALLVFFCGLYALFYCCFETGNDLLKGAAWAMIVLWIMLMIGSATMGMSTGMRGFEGLDEQPEAPMFDDGGEPTPELDG